MNAFALLCFFCLIASAIFYQPLLRYWHQQLNLYNLKAALAGNDASKQLYILYMGILKAGGRPFIELNTRHQQVKLPPNLLDDERLVLDISPSALRQLKINEDCLYFKASFSSQNGSVIIPIAAITQIFTHELELAIAIIPSANSKQT